MDLVIYTCQPKGNAVWKLIGHGSREAAFKETDNINEGNIEEDIQWYFGYDCSID